MREIIRKADVLIEAMPYIRRFHGKTVVIKYGGSVMLNEAMRRGILEDIAFMYYVGIKPVIVHGGGPFISQRIKEKGNEPVFVNGLRVTDEETIDIVEDVLSGVNKTLVDGIESFGVKARGYSPRKDKLIKVEKIEAETDIGYVGRPESISGKMIKDLLKDNFVPIIFSLAMGADAKLYNINADEVAAKIAGTLKAEKLVLLTDVTGIMRNVEDEDSVIPSLHVADVDVLIETGVIDSGMIPKAKSGIEAAQAGVKKVHMINARTPHSLLLEIFTDKGIGTEIVV